MTFATEADLCLAFSEALPSAWTAYNETAGFDIVLVHESGFQIGIEAKLRLNPKVVLQAVDTGVHRGVRAGPDAVAVLVPSRGSGDVARLCELLSVTVITLEPTPSWDRKWGGDWRIDPALPDPERIHGIDGELDTTLRTFWNNDKWFDRCPIEQASLPEYVPDVAAGHPSPVVLGRWKIQAIKVCVWVNRFGAITRRHFKALGIDPGRWMNGVWLVKGEARGEWVKGSRFPFDQFKACHPSIVQKVLDDFDIWSVENGLAELPPVSSAPRSDAVDLL